MKVFLLFLPFSTAISPIVTTPNGRLSGSQVQTPEGFSMDIFLGVPYAEPPQRFAKSILKKPWSGTYNASGFGPGCPRPGTNPGAEDCLFMKIIRPANISGGSRLPVIYWPHGGGFQAGKNSDYNYMFQGDSYVSKGPNYRIGVLGFWSTGTEENPGNWGMWDALLGLYWVKENIASFGGDPDQIVLMGQGAGAITVSLLTLSPLAQPPIFKGAIMLSGSMLSPSVNLPDSVNLDRYAAFAAAAGCDSSDHAKWNNGKRTEILDCVKALPLSTLLKHEITETLYWHPRMDGPNGLWPQPLPSLIAKRPIYPLVLGTTHDETMWDLVVVKSLFGKAKFSINMTALNTQATVKAECAVRVQSAHLNNSQPIIKACEYFYVDSIVENRLPQHNPRSPYNFWLFQAVKVGSGLHYHAPLKKEADIAFQYGNPSVYILSFDHIKEETQWFQTVESYHNLDLRYIENFFAEIYTVNYTATDNIYRQFYSSMITGFAKNCKVPWQPYNGNAHSEYWSLTSQSSMLAGFHADSVYFWNKLVPTLQNILPPSPPNKAIGQNISLLPVFLCVSGIFRNIF